MCKPALAAVLCAGALFAQPPAPGTGVIRGVVLNSQTGAPIRRATVVLNAPQIRLTADSDLEGKFEFTALPPATYRLSATRSGFLDRPPKRPIVLGPAESAQTEVRLPPASTISGRVLDESGEGIDRVRLWIYRQTYRDGRKLWDRLSLATTTADRGLYRFSNLKPGRYLVQAFNERQPASNRYNAPPQTFYPPIYYPGTPDRQQASPVELGIGAEAAGTDLRFVPVPLPPLVHVSGNITGLRADGNLSVSVTLISADDATIGGNNTQAKAPNYAFDLTAPAGAYQLRAHIYSERPDAYGRLPLTLTRDVSGVVLPMSPAPQLRVRFRVAENDAAVKLGGIGFDLELQRSTLAEAYVSDPSGAVNTAKLRPERYSIAHLQSLPDGCYVREMRLGDQPIDPHDFEVNASAELDIVLSCTAGRIAGTVVDAEGKPHLGATVTLMPGAKKVAVDDSGAFHFDSLRPGKYTLLAWEEVDDDLWPDPDYRKKFEDRAVEVEVGAKETRTVQLRAIAP